jgi:hypothetical protein
MSDRLKKVMLLALAAVLLVGVAPIQRALNRDREALGLTRQTPLENAPPMLAFTTVALGGFRGIIANALWIRMSELQDADKYFEMQQLASWITKLEPHFTHVWIVQAWNMSYNISVKFKENGPGDYSDRWRWVRAGIVLLRDDGLRYNPHDVMIHRELAWHFQHKMGANLDDANMFYKNMWAREMARVFGEQTLDIDALINPTTDDALRRLNILTNEFKMDPVVMKKVNESYGPLEWRLPEAHAIYWAAKGLAMAEMYPDKVNQDDLIQLSRVIYQSMQTSFRRGRLMSDPFANGIEIGPNLAIIPTVNKAYEEAAQARDEQYRNNIEGAHRNFLRDAVIFLYSAGREADAASWYAYIREKYPNKPVVENDPASLPGITPLGEFVLKQIGIDVTETDRDKVKARIEEFLGTAYVSLIRGNQELYAGYRLMARALRERYMKEIGKGASVDRIGLPPIEEIEREVVKRLLDPNDPVYGLPPEARAILRTELRMTPETITGTNAPATQINSTFPGNTISATNAPLTPANSPTTTNSPAPKNR